MENTGSAARDHMANERTYLAWIRTCLASAGFGVVLARVSPQTEGPVVGTMFVGLGCLLLVQATHRYFHVKRMLLQGRFRSSHLGVLFTASITFGAFLAAVVSLDRMT
eukprot:jgi/Mesvir1/13133/Mv06105-RA.1